MVNTNCLFWSKVNIKGEDECWEWMDSLNEDGYGKISIGGRDKQIKIFAHRVAKTLSIGEDIDSDMMVMHICDNPPCCNPDHLVGGSHIDNMNDMVIKGRSKKVYARAKITFEIADEIRSSSLSGYKIAEEYGISSSTVSYIRNNKIWKNENRDIAIFPN